MTIDSKIINMEKILNYLLDERLRTIYNQKSVEHVFMGIKYTGTETGFQKFKKEKLKEIFK